MKLTSEELKSLYQEGTSRAADRHPECLTAETLMRSAAGELSATERTRVADHLGSCSDCAREFRLARELKPWAEEAGQAIAESVKPASPSETIAKQPLRGALRVLGEPAARRLVSWQRLAAALSPPLRSFARTVRLPLLLLALMALGGGSLLLAVLGGGIGIALGYVAAAAVGAFSPALTATTTGVPGFTGSSLSGLFGQSTEAVAQTSTLSLSAPIRPSTLALGVVFAVVGGILAGAVGGWRAARLSPAEALRNVG
jgi:anti-sigma factor RsiW